MYACSPNTHLRSYSRQLLICAEAQSLGMCTAPLRIRPIKRGLLPTNLTHSPGKPAHPLPCSYLTRSFFSNSSLTTGESATEWARNRTRSLQWTPAANSSAVGVPRSTGSSRYALSFADELPSENPCTVFPSSEVGYESEGSVSPMSEGYSERELSDCSVSSMSTSSDKSE